jgi:flagellar hook-associated protein 2
MAEITFGGLATGLPTDDIITKLMALERRPLDRLEAQKTYEETRLKAYGQFKATLDDLKTSVGAINITSQVRSSSIRLSNEDAFSAVSNGAGSGSYDIAVAQLAQVQKSVSAGVSSQTDSLFGTGTLTLGGEVISIDSSNNSLLGLTSAINALAETTGVRASIINDGSGTDQYRLVLTGKDATTSFEPVFDLVDESSDPIVFDLTQTRSAQQAVAYVDGIKVVSDSNTLSGVISGVTINLNEASTQLTAGTPEVGVDPPDWADPPTYQTTLMTVAPDTAALKEKITSFVESYNKVMDWISSGYAEFGASKPTEQEIADGAEEPLSDVLRGDSTVNSVKRQLQNLLSSVIDTSGSLSTLSQLGITTQRDGSINLNSSTLDSALENNFDDIAKLLAGEDTTDGVMKKFNAALLSITSTSSGMYANKKDRYDGAVKRIDLDLLRMEPLIAKKEASMRSKFSAMETLISGMNSQSDFLTQQMDLLNNMTTRNR